MNIDKMSQQDYQLEGFCRGCLIKYNNPTDLVQYTEKNRHLYVYSTGLQVKRNDIFTFQLCKDCYVNMKLACKFKKQCRSSDKQFKSYLRLKQMSEIDLHTFLKNSDDTIKFPLMSGSSTPANHKLKYIDDDNESTCTSIQNFMTDILQGAEMPDTEARIIKEVIEEEADVLDDSLDSHWMQDDASIDTDFRLDFSFSPFSTSRSVNNNYCYTPNAQTETSPKRKNNHVSKVLQQLPTIQESDYGSTKDISATFQEICGKSQSNMEEDYMQDNLIEEIPMYATARNMPDLIGEPDNNFPTQNEIDMAVQNININFENLPEVKKKDFYELKDLTLELKVDIVKQQTDCTVLESDLNGQDVIECSIDKKLKQALENNNKEIPLHDLLVSPAAVFPEADGVLTPKINDFTEAMLVDIPTPKVDDFTNAILVDIPTPNVDNFTNAILVDIPTPKVNEFTNAILVDVPTTKNEDFLDAIDVLTPSIGNVPKVIKSSPPTISNVTKTIGTLSPNIVIVPKAIGAKTPKYADFPIKISTPTINSFDGAGASTPTINNILFGEKLGLVDSNSSHKMGQCIETFENVSGETNLDILEEFFNKEIKEFNQNENTEPKAKETNGIDVNKALESKNDVSPVDNSKYYDIVKCLCKICDKISKSLSSLKVHMLKVHNIKIPRKKYIDNREKICPYCAAVIMDRGNFARHLKSHKQTDHKCEVCSLTFESLWKLKQHARIHPNQNEREDKKNKNQYICSTCGAGFKLSCNLLSHARRHTEAALACQYCGKLFHRNYDRERHERTHTGERQHICPVTVCSKKFVTKHNLVTHMRKHTAEKPFQCDYCSIKFSKKSNLVKHIQTSSKCMARRAGIYTKKILEKNHSCVFCQQKYSSKGRLIKHQETYGPCIKKREEAENMNPSNIKV